jgi:endothelin-converting enzyme/putative endopeptidase
MKGPPVIRTRTFVALVAVALVAACRTPGRGAAAAAPATPGIDPSLIDAAAKPCDDFYQYACGGWIAKTAIPPDKPIWTRSFTSVDERNVELLRQLAEANAAGKHDPEDRYPDKVGDFWAACVDEAAIERRGTRDLLEAWAAIDAAGDVPGLARVVAGLHREGVFPIFTITSDQDARDATQVIGVVEQGGLSLPDRDYYTKTDERTAGIQKAYREHLARMLALAGVPADRAAREADAVYALERDLAEAQWTNVEERDPERVYNRVELAGLERLAPHFPWTAYLQALGHGGVTAFSTTTPKYLARVNELLASTPLDTWRAYVRWRLLAGMASRRALPAAFYDERFAFSSKNFTGTEKPEPRWKACVRAVEHGLGEAIGQAFVRRYFGADGKEKTSRVVSEVEGAMGRDLDGLAFMDAPTRKEARAKLARVVNKIGYPSSWRNYDALKVDRSSYFKSLLAANAFEVNRDLSKIGKPLDRNEWLMTPVEVNAYYNPAMNEMVFPAGILQPPFFTRGAPDAVNYGAAGTVIGHELTHGFDDEGRKYDAAGNLRDWWTPSVAAEFDRRAACVEKQFAAYPAEGEVKVNGKLTLGENIADLGGLKVAFAAYQASRGGKAEPPVAGFTPEQAFFLGHAQAWCTVVRPAFARMLAQVDPHAPDRWRVNGPLSNLPEFQKAFSCPAGSPMVRGGENRCEVW